ncbi:sialate O-acetylesterase [uncultured Odoribacter sp.]|uniref:sialate O-acetylesterase n=1 Tax=uncultured Odoribacter sp. TaxID=876416 RepID=UPI002614530B|nr:sialate O-acetylesterase [uncultured Odoribacter sp.]
MKISFIISIFLLLYSGIQAEVKLPAILGDHMILQQNSLINLWGKTDPGLQVRITPSWNDSCYITKADTKGEWKVKVPTPAAGGPYSLTFDDGDVLKLQHIRIGEVWICSGQSNMQMPLKGFPSQPVFRSTETLLEANRYPDLSLFTVSRQPHSSPQEDCCGQWSPSSMESAANFSAVGYYFAKYLSDVLNIPIGIIESDWGGTRIETWMPLESALKIDAAILQSDATATYFDKTAVLYNGMIAPITPYTARGFIWYQGESNKGHHDKYAANMAEMVHSWRQLWGNPEMPFFYVEIAPFDYDIPEHQFEKQPNPILRPLLVEAQLQALNLIPYSGIAATSDIGDSCFIHPSRKDLVGQRLALLALHQTYSQKGHDTYGPRFESVTYENEKAIVKFTSESELTPLYRPVCGFELAGDDRIFYPAQAQIKNGSEVEIVCTKVKCPKAVRYGFKNFIRVNLYNTMGLPAFPFRTDRWNTSR